MQTQFILFEKHWEIYFWLSCKNPWEPAACDSNQRPSVVFLDTELMFHRKTHLLTI